MPGVAGNRGLRSHILIRNIRFPVMSVMPRCRCGRLPWSCLHNLKWSSSSPLFQNGRRCHSCRLPWRYRLRPSSFSKPSCGKDSICQPLSSTKTSIDEKCPRIVSRLLWLTHDNFSQNLTDFTFGPIRGKRLVCLLPPSSFPKSITSGESPQIISILLALA